MDERVDLRAVRLEPVASDLGDTGEQHVGLAGLAEDVERAGGNGGDIGLAQLLAERRMGEALKVGVVERADDIGERGRDRLRDRGAGLGRGEPGGHALGRADVAQLAEDGVLGEEVALDEEAERFGDAVLVPRDDGGVRNGKTERAAEERGDREPVGEAADDAGFGRGTGKQDGERLPPEPCRCR